MNLHLLTCKSITGVWLVTWKVFTGELRRNSSTLSAGILLYNSSGSVDTDPDEFSVPHNAEP